MKSQLAINAGELRHTVQLQAKGAGQDPVTKKPVETWTTYLSPRVRIFGPGTKEVYQAQQFSAQVTHVLKMRWPGDGVAIKGGDQVVFGARSFNPQAWVDVEERRRVVLLYCQEINAVGA